MKKILSVLLVVTMLLTSVSTGLFGFAADGPTKTPSSASWDSPAPNENTDAVQTPPVKKAQKDGGNDLADSKRVLLIQDRLPWDSNANAIVLNNLNANYSTTTTSAFRSSMLSEYGVVILANDQTTSTYGAYGSFTSELETFVKNGGTLVYGACDEGWGAGSLTSVLPGGVRKQTVYHERNFIADKSHPIVTGVLTDGSMLYDSDLYSNYCSHVYFVEDSLPVGSNIIFRSQSNNAPTLIEYPMGEGMVIASGLTWEHNYIYHTGNDSYGTFALKAMDDFFAYAIHYYNSTIYFDLDNVGISAKNLKYNDTYFGNSAFIYNHDLSIASCALATAAMVSDAATEYAPPAAAKTILNKIGFGNEEDGEAITFSKSYNYQPQQNSIACVIANKNISSTDTSIIAISVRGGGYKAEWAGNFNVGKSGVDHNGFRIAANKVLDELSTFLRSNSGKLRSNVKFWVTGYSRAAAVANLVAKSLDDSCSTKQIGSTQTVSTQQMIYQTDDIFAYCFETPRNTTDSAAKNKKYDHIFNIVNRIDPVPRVAPLQWSFTRYGVDCYLPSKETTGKPYTNLVKKMKENYKCISNGNYTEDYKYYEFNLLAKEKIKETNDISQGVFLDNLIQLISKKVIKSRKVFADDYQSTVMSLLNKAYTSGFDFPDDLIPLFSDYISNYLSDNLSVGYVIKNHSIKAILTPAIKSFCEEYQINLTDKEISDAVNLLDKAFMPFVENLSLFFTAIYNGADLIIPHRTETTLAWLLTLKGEYANGNPELIKKLTKGEKSYRIATINCPVNVRVYDTEGDLRGEIIENEVQDVGEFGLSVYINDDGEKCFVLPDGEEFRFEIEGYDDGNMSLSFADFDFTIEEKTTSENYYDIPIQAGTKVAAVLAEKSELGVSSDVAVFDEENNIIEASETINYNDAEIFNVTATSDNEQCSVFGGGDYYKGEFSQVTTVPAEHHEFIGWYSGDNLVSNEFQYRFRVESNMTLVARFNAYPHTYKATITSEPTCTSEGLEVYTCDCGDSYTEIIPALGHVDEANDGFCDRCGEMMTDGDHCPKCGRIHNGGFFDSILGFFHRIIYRLTHLFSK